MRSEFSRDAMGMEINLSDIVHVEAKIQDLMKNHKESPSLMQMSPSIGALRHLLLTTAVDVPLQTPKQLSTEQLYQ